MLIYIFICLSALAVAALYLTHHHQCRLRDMAFLMGEAVRNGDFTFRLPSGRLLFGEKALLRALNDMENSIGRLTARSEVESWEKLTRVLTHEINNATTPILSICQAYLASPSAEQSPYREGLEAIRDTTTALAAFVDSYRKMTQIQQPEPSDVQLHDFISGIACMYPSLSWSIDIPDDTVINIDPNLLRQSIVNIVKNAVEAGADNVGIRWSHALYISNNGVPIPPEAQRDMFVPFYTTKRLGSGIGLPLSRQILLIQGYDLSLAPIPQIGYTVTFVVELGVS